MQLGDGKFHSQSEAELGYPHELILDALAKSQIAIEQEYRTRVKLFACLLRTLLKEKPGKVQVPDKADATLRMLESLTKASHLKDAHENYRNRLHQLMEVYSGSRSAPSLDDLREFVEDGVLMHILSRELGKGNLLSQDDTERISEILNETCGELTALLSAVRLWEGSSCDAVSGDIINALASPEGEKLQEAAIFVSYALAIRCSPSKRELLVVHYRLVRKAVENLSDTANKQNLTDDLLERVFRVAIVLFLCGYLKSIRLPQEEKIRYVDEIIKTPSVEQVFGEVFDSVATVPIPKTESKAPLWILAVVDLVLLILHWTIEIQKPFETSVLGVSISIPAVPVFLLFAIIVLLALLWRLLNLRRNIIKTLRRGNN
jgi:uncharacterized integral membrane protein